MVQPENRDQVGVVYNWVLEMTKTQWYYQRWK